MKKMLKQNKGFSLVELLVAILIMAVIAGTAITLFSGVLNSSRKNADEETAENIKRAILTYMNLTNDTNLNCLGMVQKDPDDADGKPLGGTWSQSYDLIAKLCCVIKIAEDGTDKTKTDITFTTPPNVTLPGTGSVTNIDNATVDNSDIFGDFGPFLDGTKDMAPKTPGNFGWEIQIDSETQVIKVEVKEKQTDSTVKFN